jgi:hypothetical protein
MFEQRRRYFDHVDGLQHVDIQHEHLEQLGCWLRGRGRGR